MVLCSTASAKPLAYVSYNVVVGADTDEYTVVDEVEVVDARVQK